MTIQMPTMTIDLGALLAGTAAPQPSPQGVAVDFAALVAGLLPETGDMPVKPAFASILPPMSDRIAAGVTSLPSSRQDLAAAGTEADERDDMATDEGSGDLAWLMPAEGSTPVEPRPDPIGPAILVEPQPSVTADETLPPAFPPEAPAPPVALPDTARAAPTALVPITPGRIVGSVRAPVREIDAAAVALPASPVLPPLDGALAPDPRPALPDAAAIVQPLPHPVTPDRAPSIEVGVAPAIVGPSSPDAPIRRAAAEPPATAAPSASPGVRDDVAIALGVEDVRIAPAARPSATIPVAESGLARAVAAPVPAPVQAVPPVAPAMSEATASPASAAALPVMPAPPARSMPSDATRPAVPIAAAPIMADAPAAELQQPERAAEPTRPPPASEAIAETSGSTGTDVEVDSPAAPSRAAPAAPLASAPAAAPISPAISTAPPAAPTIDPVAGAAPVPLSPAAQPAASVAASVPVADARPLDTARADWIETLVERFETVRDSAGLRHTTLRLAPDALGAIDVRIVEQGGEVRVQMTVETAQARALIAEAAPRLAELAEARGLKLGETSVDLGRGGERRPQPHDAEPQPSAAPPSAAAADDAADADAGDRIA